jgi:hypothetical protein
MGLTEDWAPHPPFPDKPMQGKDLQGFFTGNHCGIMAAPLVLHFTTAFGQKIRNGILPKLASNRKKGET